MSEHEKTDNATLVELTAGTFPPQIGFVNVHEGNEEFYTILPAPSKSRLFDFFSLISWFDTATSGDAHAGEEVLGYNGHYFQVGVLRKDRNNDSVEFDWTVLCEETRVELGGITDFVTSVNLRNSLKIKKP